jgi:glycosyltransferase involved in cell wall biosynthesis
MRRSVVFLEQQSWTGGAQRVLEAALDSIGTDYERIVAFPGRGPFRSALEEKAIETIDLPIGDYRPGKKSFVEKVAFGWRSLVCGLKLASFIRRRRVALVYINGPRCMPAGVLAAWLTRRPAIFHLHLFLTRRLDITLVALLARRVSRILACCQAAGALLLDRDHRLASKTDVVYNPLPQVANRTSSPVSRTTRSSSDRITIGMVGRITEKKGQLMLLRAVGGLSSEIRGRVQLLIVGAEAPACLPDFVYAQSLRAEATRLGLDGQVTWTGYLADTSPCYAAMDVLVHPALPPEALSIVILEALNSGVPVVATMTGGIPEMIQDGFNGLLVPPGDELALRQALELILENDQVRERLQEGARSGLDYRFLPERFSFSIRSVIGELCPQHERL